ncbi:CAP domain-containing protein [Bacillaceae bacterium IKA-2]|nr:CAP domain-containing protein [Bacillaceae bacterium IKA-2]
MKKLGCGFFVCCLVISIFIYVVYWGDNLKGIEDESSLLETPSVELSEKKVDIKSDTSQKDPISNVNLGDGLHTFIGQTVEFLVANLGEPERKDLSAYDYEWWIYADQFASGYLQIGVENDQIVTVYVIGEDLPTGLIQIGATYNEISALFSFDQEVSFNINNNSYQFKLSDDDLQMRPIIQEEDVFIQLYFDLFTQKLSSIRYISPETVIKQRPYSVVYRGNLIESKPLSNQKWEEVQKGSSLQIFEITNQIRKRHQLSLLSWDEVTADVAFLHSKDMKLNEYFSHTSPEHGELTDRLKKQGILYQLAAENIAAKYVDAIAAVEGWLNSEGHRVNMLHEDFTHLGVGVYERYYTQNFITPWK